MEEIDNATQNCTERSSMDNDESHPRMFKHLGAKFKSLPLRLYKEIGTEWKQEFSSQEKRTKIFLALF